MMNFLIIVYLFFCACYRICPKKNIVTKVQRWEENLFSALVDEKGWGVERIVEMQMAYSYQHMDTEDLGMVGSISNIESGYLLFGDIGLRALLSLYCAKDKGFRSIRF